MLWLGLIIPYIVTGTYAWLMAKYWGGWRIKPTADDPVNLEHKTRISVIIAARNEAPNIGSCIDSIIAQTYPRHLFEIIVVDDHSTDSTAEVVRSRSEVKLLLLQDVVKDPLNSYKKKAIETGIAAATGELIVSTDADCIVPATWLSNYANLYEKDAPVFIAAPVAFFKEKNFLQIFQSLDFMSMQGITGSAIHMRYHYMCNGANLAYRRSVFYEVGGFAGIDSVASGDDMLLMQKISKVYPKGISYLKSRSAIVHTAAANSIKEFFNQRIRWASKADKYPDKKMTWILVFIYLFNLCILGSAVATIFYPRMWISVYILVTGKTIVELLFLYPVAKFFHKRHLLWWFPLCQPFHIIYIIIAGWLGKFGSYTWKERRVK